MTQEEMGGPTSPGGLKEQATRLSPLFKHDDDDDDDIYHIKKILLLRACSHTKTFINAAGSLLMGRLTIRSIFIW